MGTIAILAASAFGAWTGNKKNLCQIWIYFVCCAFAVYLGIFSTPLLLAFIPNVPGYEEYRTPAVILILILIFLVLFYKIIGQVMEDASDFDRYLFPSGVDRTGRLIFGFLSGGMTAAFLILCFCQFPFSKEIKAINRDSLRSASVAVVRTLTGTINFFSAQTLSKDSAAFLESLAVDPPKKETEEVILKKIQEKRAAAKKKPKKMRLTSEGYAVPLEEEEHSAPSQLLKKQEKK